MAVWGMKTFRATLESSGDGLRWTVARIPFDPAQAWPERRGRRVRGEINGYAFRTALFPEAGGKKHILLVNKKMQAGAQAGPGDSVRIRLEPDLEERETSVPAEMARLLKSDKDLRRFYETLSPSRRRDVVRWIAEPKSGASRTRRAEQVAEWFLLAAEGERELPPVLRLAFQRHPAAQGGWEAMTPARRRNHLLYIFHCQSGEGRQKRTLKAVEDALKLTQRQDSALNGTDFE
jgi:uncharacterized protein YdeI (YjbR/CyaY-like superfamily)